VGPGIKNAGQIGNIWTDHTDARPTMLTLLGLGDDYETDGRAVDQLYEGWATPASLKNNKATTDHLADAYKQLTAPFGQFGMDTLVASTRALKSNSAGDADYTNTESSIASLTNQRDALALQIRHAFNQAESGGVPISSSQAKSWTKQANDLIAQAAALAAGP
jgi:hypothetical protein